MKTPSRFLALAAVAGLTLAAAALAQAPPYDKKTEATLKGAILEVKPVDTPSGVQGTHLMMQDGKAKIEVFAGPTPFLAKIGASFAKGDHVEVVGSKMDIKGVSALVARQIKKGGKTYEVRDAAGEPLWNKKS